MSDAERVEILKEALRRVRDRNRRRPGMVDTETQRICRTALKLTASDEHANRRRRE